MKVVYVIGPYSAPTPEQVRVNVALAADAGEELFQRGYAPIVTHSLTMGWDDYPHADIMELCLALLSKCDCVCVLDGWETSLGSRQEIRLAKALKIPVYYGVKEVPEIDGI